MPRSAFKLSRFEQNQLVDDTAAILASMVKTRRSIFETNLALHVRVLLFAKTRIIIVYNSF